MTSMKGLRPWFWNLLSPRLKLLLNSKPLYWSILSTLLFDLSEKVIDKKRESPFMVCEMQIKTLQTQYKVINFIVLNLFFSLVIGTNFRGKGRS